MSGHKQPGSRNAILIAGSVMVLYLAALISFGYVGQVRLLNSLHDQEQLLVEKQAAAIAHFLREQQNILDQLGKSPEVKRFLTARGLGRSMEPETRALTGAFAQAHESNVRHGRRAFDGIALVAGNGHVLLEIAGTGVNHAQQRYSVREPPVAGEVHVRRGPAGTQLAFTTEIEIDSQAVAYLIADVDAEKMLNPFLRIKGSSPGRHQTAVLDAHDRIVASGDTPDWIQQYHAARGYTVRFPSMTVSGTGLRVLELPHAGRDHGFLTSPMFLGALALMGLPLLGGVIYLLRLNYRNLVLKTRVEATAQQRAALHKQNERLQSEIDKRLESEQKLAHQANYDQLTGLPNRNLALDRLAQAIKWAKRDGRGVLTMFLDLDRFKQVNDSLGHSAGDELLREAAQRLESSVRDSDTVSRLGGDEFLLICPEISGQADWEQLAQQLLKTLSAPFYIGDHEFFIGVSIGVAAFPEGGREPHNLLKNADIAMYAAKEQGRNRYCYYDPSMDAAAMQGMRLENNLRHALEKGEFHLVFQPIVAIGSGRVIAVEALLRWENEQLGSVSPDTFIPVAEETGLIHDIGEWVLIEACRAISEIQSGQPVRVAVNLSPKQFSRPGRLLECILYALRQSGLMPNQLELEITETILIDDRPEIGELINQLDRIGVRLSIDDFGTGYSALNYLQRFPFDVLKIDRSFTRLAPASKANASLIRAIIAMAHALDLEVVAEGIETREQAGFLLVYHCEYGQGFLYSRPMPARQLQIHLAGEQAAVSA